MYEINGIYMDLIQGIVSRLYTEEFVLINAVEFEISIEKYMNSVKILYLSIFKWIFGFSILWFSAAHQMQVKKQMQSLE